MRAQPAMQACATAPAGRRLRSNSSSALTSSTGGPFKALITRMDKSSRSASRGWVSARHAAFPWTIRLRLRTTEIGAEPALLNRPVLGSSHSSPGTPREARNRPSAVTAELVNSRPRPNDWAARLVIATSALFSSRGNGDCSADLTTSATRLFRPGVRQIDVVPAMARICLCVDGSRPSSRFVSATALPMRPVVVVLVAF